MIYLNNASTTWPKPDSVINAVHNSLVTPPVNYGRTGITRGDKNIVNDCRSSISELFNAGNDYNMVFTSGSTEALNLALKGIELSGRNVIITATEHNSVIRPLKSLEKSAGISITIVPCGETGYVSPKEIESAITDKTALICVNHCSNVTGTVQDIEAISLIAKSREILFLVDGSQSAGVIEINLSVIQPDFFCFTGHKSLYGIQGTGGLIFKKEINLRPLKEGGTGTLSHILEQPDVFPSKYESGTMNIPGIAALEAGIKWVKEIGITKIQEHKKMLIEKIINEIQRITGITLYCDKNKSCGAILSLNIKDIAPEEINYILSNSFDISVRSGIHCAPLIHKYLGTQNYGTLRISPSFFTTDEEIDKFISSFKKIISNLNK